MAAFPSTNAIQWGGVSVENKSREPALGIDNTNTGKQIATIKLDRYERLLGFVPDSKTHLVGGSEFVIYESENGKIIRTLTLFDGVDSHNWSERKESLASSTESTPNEDNRGEATSNKRS